MSVSPKQFVLHEFAEFAITMPGAGSDLEVKRVVAVLASPAHTRLARNPGRGTSPARGMWAVGTVVGTWPAAMRVLDRLGLGNQGT